MPIRLLPHSVTLKIAAGEVVDRPASVVKELVENALDAGATEVTVTITGGGVELLRVQDNGCGLPPEEVPLAFERYATSKLTGLDDFDRLRTLGFRGEALPSIASVADVTLVTRRPEAVGGYFYHVRGGLPLEEAPRAAPTGTTVTVRELFREVPARRKFLRAPATEASHCIHAVTEYALARPEVRFTITNDNRRVLLTPGTGELRDAAAAVLGAETAEQLLPVPCDTTEGRIITVSGLVSPPGVTRASRGGISLFVNGRWVQNRSLSFAVEEAYQGLLMVGRYPIAVLRVDLPPSEVDVNVHPRKLEVRFTGEREVFSAVQRAVRAALMAQPAGSHPLQPRPPAGAYPPSLTLSPSASQAALRFQAASVPDLPAAGSDADVPAMPPPPPALEARLPLLRVVGQMGGTYLVAEGPEGLYLVDQHAAHERVLYERVLAMLQQRPADQQGLLDPLLLASDPQDIPLLLAEQALLARFGFVFEPFGEREVLLRALPAGVRAEGAAQVLSELVQGLRTPEGRTEKLATTVACHSAVRAGDTLTLPEMRRLIEDLEACLAPQTCPHGRPTMLHMSTTQLEREFGRRG